jgi:glutamate dehydrogenase/leucine dehydrogenase
LPILSEAKAFYKKPPFIIEMSGLLKKFELKKPEIVFEWNDPETEAEGWVVINSLRNGAAGGGTRMRKGLDRSEVEALAKTMEVKFTVSGPAIGGAKSGINFDPADPRKRGVLERWYKAVIPLLKNYYGTGGDLNIDEIHEVIPITEDYGLWHPQEGVVNGHFKPTEPQKIHKIGQLRQGVSKVIEDPKFSPDVKRKYTIADMITGYGVAESVLHYYKLWNGSTQGKKAIIQGWGNVGAAAGWYLAKQGVKIIGIIDRDGGLINENGFSIEEINQLFLSRRGNKLYSPALIPFEVMNEKIWSLGAEIFVPAASSRLLDRDQISALKSNGLEVMACGANVPFKDAEIFYGPIAEYADGQFSVIPDFIANCGMARVFAYLMSGETDLDMTDEALFGDTSLTIKKALQKTRENCSGHTFLIKFSLENAISQLI